MQFVSGVAVFIYFCSLLAMLLGMYYMRSEEQVYYSVGLKWMLLAIFLVNAAVYIKQS